MHDIIKEKKKKVEDEYYSLPLHVMLREKKRDDFAMNLDNICSAYWNNRKNEKVCFNKVQLSVVQNWEKFKVCPLLRYLPISLHFRMGINFQTWIT